MSVQFGKCNFDGRPVDPADLEEARPVLAPYGPDGEGFICKDSVGVIYRAFHTTRESRTERQPFISTSGIVITWDGRLDNREELSAATRLPLASTDVEFVAAAYDKWGTESFARLIGDWAMSICNPADRSLILAKDFIGVRHLYYSVWEDQVTWCSILHPLVLFARRSLVLNGEYLAGWLSSFPAEGLTPYLGICSVPASCFIQITKNNSVAQKYWELDRAKRILYRTDSAYEEHFRSCFSTAVRRRLRSDRSVIAELSGGMDSSSVVCVADTILRQGDAEAPRLDTISYYDDTEPNWNERPFIAKVEEWRGQSGCHVNLASHIPLKYEFTEAPFAPTPASICNRDAQAELHIVARISSDSRILLSGTGGDEFTGGVPTPIPELMDLVRAARVGQLAQQLKTWALDKRKPWVHLLWEAVRAFLPPAIGSKGDPPKWLNPTFVKNHRHILTGYQSRLRFFGGLPSFQHNVLTLNLLRRQMACAPNTESILALEKRYPYLDRDLVEFLCAIPADQLVRPGQRRSLMRRALAGVVPDAILNRRRKAFLVRTPVQEACAMWKKFCAVPGTMLTVSLKILDDSVFAESLKRAEAGLEINVVTAKRALLLEYWLRQMVAQNYLRILETDEPTPEPQAQVSAVLNGLCEQ